MLLSISVYFITICQLSGHDQYFFSSQAMNNHLTKGEVGKLIERATPAWVNECDVPEKWYLEEEKKCLLLLLVGNRESPVGGECD